MELTINERITLLFAMRDRRRELMTIARGRIEHLKLLEMDIAEDKDFSYWVSEINLCTRLMAKIWSY